MIGISGYVTYLVKEDGKLLKSLSSQWEVIKSGLRHFKYSLVTTIV